MKKMMGFWSMLASTVPLATRIVNKDLQILPNKEYLPYFTYSTSSPDAVGCPP